MAGSRTLKLSILADVDNLKKNLDTGSKDVQTFGDKLGDFGKKAGLAFAAAGVAAAAYASKLAIEGVKAAIEDEAAQAKLAATLKNVTGATDDQIAAVEKQILKTALLTGKTDDELRPSFDRLLRSTKNVTQAQDLQTLALDIAAGTGKSLTAVSDALARAHDGNFVALRKLGGGIDENIIKSKDFDAATASLAKTFKDQASTQADTFQGKMLRLNVAFDEAKETVGAYILDAITPLVSSLSDNLFPIFSKVNDFISGTLIPTFKEIYDFFRKFLTPVIEGLKSAFDKVSQSLKDNSDELQPLTSFMKEFYEFVKKFLVPLLGGAFKLALEAIGTIVAGLVTSFSRLVGFISSTITKLKEFVEFVKNNPVTRFFFGGSDGKSLKTSASFEEEEDMSGFGGFGGFGKTDPFKPTGIISPATGADIGAYSPAMQAAIIRREQLKAETERLRVARAEREDARAINITVNGAIDKEGVARQIVDIIQSSNMRGTNGSLSLQAI
jgi:hypothetical protein